MTLHQYVAVLREWFHRSVGIAFKMRADRDLAEELEHHISEIESELRQRGYSEQDAARLARIRAGNKGRALEDLRAQRGVPWFGPFTLDLRLGLRHLRKYWVLSFVGGLAIAVALTISALAYLYFDVFWRVTLPLDESDRIVGIQALDPAGNRKSEVPARDYERLREELTVLDDLGAFENRERLMTVNGTTQSVSVAEMTSSGFELARVAPLLGRAFERADETSNAERVVVIGYDVWQAQFDGKPSVLGEIMRLDDTPHTIIGIMPRGFRFPVNHGLWTPLRKGPAEFLPPPPDGIVFGRLAPGITLQLARSQLQTIRLSTFDESRVNDERLRLHMHPYADNFIEDMSPDDYASRFGNARLIVLVLSLLLLPPCVNIAILVYARTVTRQEEIALRTALGASRPRIVIQLFVEMLVLTFCAGALALLGVWLVALYVQNGLNQQPVTFPFWLDIGLSWRTIVFVFAMSTAAALVAGLIPALRTTKRLAQPGLRGLDRQNRTTLGAAWTSLIVCQIAFSFALLPPAIEIAWGHVRADVLGPGFNAEEYLTARISSDGATESENPDERDSGDNAISETSASLAEQLNAEGVSVFGIALSSALPGTAPTARIEIRQEAAIDGIQNQDIPTDIDLLDDKYRSGFPTVRYMQIGDTYFDVFNAEVLAGRPFFSNEFETPSNVVIVDQTFVQSAFDGQNPLGQQLRYLQPGGSGESPASAEIWYDVVGVVADVPAHPSHGTVYHPLSSRWPAAIISMHLTTRNGGYETRLREIASAENPGLVVEDVHLLSEVYEQLAFGKYLIAYSLLGATLSVLLLSAAGTYALMMFTVNARRREIGIHMALGAKASRLLSRIFRRSLRQVSLGALAGLAVAWYVRAKIPVQAMGGWSVPGIIPVAVLLLTVIGLLAASGPALKALGIDPTEALREDG